MNQSSNIFTKKQKLHSKPSSEPTVLSQEKPNILQNVVEDAKPLSHDDIIRILSPMDRASIVKTFVDRSGFTSNRIPSIYSSYFFRKDIVNAYVRDLTNTTPTDRVPFSPLSKYNLYNKDDILNNIMTRPGEIGTRYTEKNSSYTSMSIDTVGKVIKYLSSSVCNGIKQGYAQKAIENSLLKIRRTKQKDIASGKMIMSVSSVDSSDYFDLLLVSTKKLEDVSLPIEQRLSEVAAFIVVELGECSTYPASYSINLICADTKKSTGMGSILMGAYLYTILSHPIPSTVSDNIMFPSGNGYLSITTKRTSSGTSVGRVKFGTEESLTETEHIAVLELADAYANPGGLCMYEKYGFTFDPSMFKEDCFTDRDNLPMIIDFNAKPGYKELDISAKKTKIIAITIGADSGFPKEIICSLRGKRQELLGYLKSMKLKEIVDPNYKYNDLLGAYQKIYDTILYIHEPIYNVTVRTRPPPSHPGTVDEFITYLESTPQPSIENPEMELKIEKLISYIPKTKPKKGGTRRRYKRASKKTRKTRVRRVRK